MKKWILVIGSIVVIILALKWVESKGENMDGLAGLGDVLKEKAENFKLSVEDWEIQGTYDIDEEDWFADGVEILKGDCERTRVNSGYVNLLILKAAGCKVEILPSADGDYYIEFSNMKKVQAYQDDGDLVVKAMRDTEWNQDSENSVLRLYVPEENSPETVEIELGAGSLFVEKLQAKEIKCKVEAGKLVTEQLRAENLEAELGAGAVSLSEIDVTNLELSVGAGNMGVQGKVSGNVDAECAMGNLELLLEGTKADYNYELQCVAGNIQIADEKYSGIKEEKTIKNASEKVMELECAMGNMKVEYY